jgi:hypothetical protein
MYKPIIQVLDSLMKSSIRIHPSKQAVVETILILFLVVDTSSFRASSLPLSAIRETKD